MLDTDVTNYLEEFDYALSWDEPILGHISGRVWEAVLPDGQGVYIVRRHHGTLVEGVFEPTHGVTVLPASRSRSFNFWVEGADHYVKDKKEGWLKTEQAEHLCRLWCETHAMDNKLIPDVRKKDEKQMVDPGEFARASEKLRNLLGL